MSKNVIVIGSGAAGMTAASEAKKNDPLAKVMVITEDEHIAYSPCAIPWVIEGKMKWTEIVMHDPSFYSEKRDITVITKTKVTAVDPEKKVVTADKAYPYDSLVVATGGTVFIPPIKGVSLKGTFTVRTVNDAIAISEAAKKTDKVAIIGAGVIGLEIALALRNINKDVTVVEMFEQVIPRIADKDMAAMIQTYLESEGVKFIFGKGIESVDGTDKVEGVTAGGKSIPCGMVIFATGVRANLEIPKMLGLDTGKLGAVLVSPTMQPYRTGTLVEDIYLAGDLVQSVSAVVDGPTMSQLGSSAVKQGIVAGRNAADGSMKMSPTVTPWISAIGEMEIGGTGLSEGLASWYGIKVVSATATGLTCARYYPGGKSMTVKILADESDGRIVGAQIVAGSDVNGRINWLSSVIAEKMTVKEFLYAGENAYCPPTSMVRDTIFDAAEALSKKLSK